MKNVCTKLEKARCAGMKALGGGYIRWRGCCTFDSTQLKFERRTAAPQSRSTPPCRTAPAKSGGGPSCVAACTPRFQATHTGQSCATARWCLRPWCSLDARNAKGLGARQLRGCQPTSHQVHDDHLPLRMVVLLVGCQLVMLVTACRSWPLAVVARRRA